MQCGPARRPQLRAACCDRRGRKSASAALTVTRTESPTSLVITPSTRTLRIGEAAELNALTGSGAAVDAAEWNSSDPSVASISAERPGLVTAHSAGEAVITATTGTLAANATIRVLTAGSWPAGEARWILDAPPAERTIPAHRSSVSLRTQCVMGLVMSLRVFTRTRRWRILSLRVETIQRPTRSLDFRST